MKERSESWLSHVQSLSVQGEFFKLDALQEKSVEWKSIIYNLPHKVARFLMNSLTHTLNTNANLVRWGKMTSAKCNKCNNRETVHHVLNACPVPLDEGRYTWRHDNILLYILETMQKGINASNQDVDITSDLKLGSWSKQGISTVPLQCTQTNLIPDICALWKNEKKLVIVELSVPFETNTEKTHEYKERKYAPLISDIESKRYSVKYSPIEVGSRGYISPDNTKRLKMLLNEFGKPTPYKIFRDNLSKLAVTSSFVIYY